MWTTGLYFLYLFSKPKTASTLPPYNGAVVVPGRTFLRPKNYYMPIPQVVIDQSKSVLKQTLIIKKKWKFLRKDHSLLVPKRYEVC